MAARKTAGEHEPAEPAPAGDERRHQGGREHLRARLAGREHPLIAPGRDRPDGTGELGDSALPLGVSVAGERPRFACECFDATQHAPHLAGALGDELTAELFARGWIERAGGRAVRVTAKGTRGPRRTFGVAL